VKNVVVTGETVVEIWRDFAIFFQNGGRVHLGFVIRA